MLTNRWSETVGIANDSSVEFIIYPGLGHVITYDILRDIEDFFIKHGMKTRGMPWLFLLLDD